MLPFVHRKAEDLGRRLKRLVESNFELVKMNVAFKTSKTIGEMFSFKDKVTNILEKSLVVYKIKCKQCKAEYIGITERILGIRVKEHKKNTLSSVKKHELDNPGHQMDYENVEVIDNANNDFKLRMKELLHILKSEPELNKQLNSQSNFEIKTLIINAYPHYRN